MQNNSNKNWENKGWEAMQQMLDQELPIKEEKPKRRMGWWLWAAGFSILVSAGWAVFLTSQNNGFESMTQEKTAVDKEFEKTPDFENVDNSITDVENVDFDREKHSDFKKEINNYRSDLSDENSFNAGVKGADSQLVTSRDSEIFYVKNTEKNQVDFQNVDNLKGVVENSENNPENSQFLLEESESADSPISIKNGLDLMADLPIRMTTLELGKYEIPDSPKPIFAKAKKILPDDKKIRSSFGVSTGMIVTTDPKINGFETAGIINLPLGNSKFSIETGLAYKLSRQQILKKDWSASGSQILDKESVDDITSVPQVGATDPTREHTDEYFYESAGKLVSTNPRSFHVLEIPVYLQYNFHPKWNLFLGAKTSLNLNAVFEKLSSGTELDNAFSPEGSGTSFNFQRFDFAAVGGVNFQPIKLWNFQLRYDHGNLLKNDTWQLNNRYFTVSAGYKIGHF